MSQPEDASTVVDPVALANQLFERHYARCFWHLRRDRPITRETIPLVVNGLRTNGGRQEFLDAARLEKLASADRSCR